MSKNPKSVKFKVISGYILLFATAVASIWFAYTEILKIAGSDKSSADNDKLIKISNTIAQLYAGESLGRTAILTGRKADLNRYLLSIDSVNTTIKDIKKTVNNNQIKQLDTVQMLLDRKVSSIKEIMAFRKKHPRSGTYKTAIRGINRARDSIWDKTKPVTPLKSYAWNGVAEKLLTPKQLDSLRKLPVSNDTLTIAYNKAIIGAEKMNQRLNQELILKEINLLEENRVISDQLRVIIANVESEFLQKSYAKFQQSQLTLNKTAENMAWIGAITLFVIIVLATIIVRDLTNNQNYRRQLEILNHENQDLLHSKSMLMATVTHDLQTPLGSIIGFNDLLKNSGVNARQKQYLSNIKESADYILNLVNDLLDFSRLENNRISIEHKAFNVKNAIESTCRALEPIALEKDIELNWDIAEELNAFFLSDPYRIKQVLTNLVSNAVKFTPEGSVEVAARIEDAQIIIQVIDTGIGISEDKHDAVFKEFTQAHSGIEKKFGGTGLGLTISKRIIELLGGTISLESQEGKGSIFTIALPCIAAEDPIANDETISKAIIPAGIRVLAVDDDHVQLMLMKELLTQYGIEAITEINAVAVLKLLDEQHFDLLLTDIQMPALDGFGLIKLIRRHENPDVAKIPAIALSGKKDLTAEDFTAAGFTAHHTKPVQIEALLDLIAGIVPLNTNAGIERKNTAEKAQGLYSLRSLSQFTNNDPASLKTIVNTFIESTADNCEVLLNAAEENDETKLAQIAHKMIPMLRQIEAHSIADLLLPLEEGTISLTADELEHYAQDICRRMEVLCANLQTEIAS